MRPDHADIPNDADARRDDRSVSAAEPCELAPGGPRTASGNARVFAALVILATLAPIGLGFNVGRFAPRLPSLDWSLAIDQRVRQAADAARGPKVVFIGGSNLRFGLDAASLGRRLGTPVVNYGLHASLGIDVIADRAAEVIGPGDVVVYAPELSHFRVEGPEDFSDDLRIDFLAAHPSSIDPALQSTPTREWYRARSRCNRLRSKAERLLGGRLARFAEAHAGGGDAAARESDDPKLDPYNPAGIGPDGQFIAPRPGPKPPSQWTYSDPPTRAEQMDLVASRGAAALDLLWRACAARHATLYVMPPMRLGVEKFRSAGILPGMLDMERLWTGAATTRGAHLLLPPGENVLDYAYGFDTDYHLNERGVALMQPRLEAALRTALQTATPASGANPR